jgi:ADP-dependent NAD(P)H-hydrate dehydratase / NAD(P)H-hydrate epimerase
MQPVVTAAEMRALDRATIEDIGIPAITLMETAGRGVARVAMDLLDGNADGNIAVVCGPGNNGGDGFVAARVLRDAGHDAVVYLAAARDAVRGDAAAHLAILERAGGVVHLIDTPQALEQARESIAGAALAIDALFGVGLARPIEGHHAEVVGLVDQAAMCLAVDLPSGLDADTGRALGACVTADVTVTMGALKIALVSAPGFARCGAVEVVDIGIPRGVLATQAIGAGLVEAEDVAATLPRSSPLVHKGRRGHVLVIGGMPGMRGAGRLCANASLRGGAGLVTLASTGDPSADDAVMTAVLETRLADVLAGKDAVVMGPGLGQSAQAASWLREVLASGVPAVLDADALNLVAGDPALADAVANASGPIVLTPHPGEAARLLGLTAAAVEADRLAAARALASRTHAVVVLKGARTIVCDGTIDDEYCAINPTGGPELATGGSGDVLAGLVASLLAQGTSPADAARAAVYVHGRAGERLAVQHGSRGVVSSDLPLAIAGALRELAM